MCVRVLGHMRNAVHLTFWEECLLWPFQAALGASVLPYSVPPSSLNPSYLSGPSSGPDSPVRSNQSHHRYSTTAPAVLTCGGSREAVVEGDGEFTPS